jgi:hypothetical protein
LESSEAGLLGADSWPARIVLPNGDWFPGRAAQDDPGQITGDLRVDFGPLPADTREVRIVFGPFLRKLDGPFEVNIDVSAGAPWAVVGERMELSVVKEADRSGVAVTNVNAGPRTIVYVPPDDPTLVDDQGGEYEFAGASWGGTEDEEGASIAGGGVFWFEGDLDPAATVLTLSIPSMARFEYGPEFTVTLPSGFVE